MSTLSFGNTEQRPWNPAEVRFTQTDVCKDDCDQATWVISLDAFNWFSRRRCREKRSRECDKDHRLLISLRHLIKGDEEQQTITLLCALDQKGCVPPQLWRTSRSSPSLAPPRPSFPASPQRRHLSLEHRFTLPSLSSFISECLNEAIWTRLIANMQQTFTFTHKDLNILTQRGAVAKNCPSRFMILCDENTPPQLPSGTEDCSLSSGETRLHIDDKNATSIGKYSPKWPDDSNNSKDVSKMPVSQDNVSTSKHRCLVKSCSDPGASFRRDKNVKQRKSVSFDDDVMVYLFDQESPTMKLLSGPSSSPSDTFNCNLTDVAEEGLEWEDDFSAVEKGSHFRCGRQPVSEIDAPTSQSRSFLSQSCLFLTHVTESDLEL